jgi:hypothetical protein
MVEFVKSVAAVLLCMIAFAGTARATDPASDQWLPLHRFIGEWSGIASGEGGDGTVTRKYTFVMSRRFVHESNTSRYPPQERNKSGEVHEHWGIFSYDKARKVLVLRQFHASERIARRLGNAFVAPVMAYVPEGDLEPPTGHMAYPGTITLPNEHFMKVVEFAARSFKVP